MTPELEQELRAIGVDPEEWSVVYSQFDDLVRRAAARAEAANVHHRAFYAAVLLAAAPRMQDLADCPGQIGRAALACCEMAWYLAGEEPS